MSFGPLVEYPLRWIIIEFWDIYRKLYIRDNVYHNYPEIVFSLLVSFCLIKSTGNNPVLRQAFFLQIYCQNCITRY